MRIKFAVCVLALGLLAGCSDGDAPEPAPSETATALPSSPNDPTRTGAQAFVGHYFDVLNAALTTGETQSLAALSARECGSCTSVISYIDELYDAGGRVETQGWDVRRLKSLGRSPDGEPTFHLAIHQPSELTYTSPSAEPRETRPATKFFYVYVKRSGGAWTLRDFTLTDAEL